MSKSRFLTLILAAQLGQFVTLCTKFQVPKAKLEQAPQSSEPTSVFAIGLFGDRVQELMNFRDSCVGSFILYNNLPFTSMMSYFDVVFI